MHKSPVRLATRLLLLTGLAGLLFSGNSASAQQPGTARTPNSRDRALSSAVSKGDLQAVRAALAAGANVNQSDEYGETALAFAAQFGNLSLVQLLLAYGADTNSGRPSGRSPLAMATQNGSLLVVRLLLAHGANARVRDSYGEGLLMYSATAPAVAKLLVAHGAPVNIHNRFGDTPLKQALLYDNAAFASVLLNSGADPNAADSEGTTPLLESLLSALSGNMAGVRLLLAHGANVNQANKFGQAPLEQAARNGEAEVVTLLLRHKANPLHRDQAGSTALMSVAQQGGHGDILIASHPHDDPPPTPQLIAVLMRKAAASDTAIVRALLVGGAKADGTEGRTALLLASASGNTPVVRALLVAGTNPNTKGREPLYSLGGLTFFEEPGYDELNYQPHPVVPRKLTPLMYAAYNGQTEALQALLAAKANPNLQDSTGSTALMYACDQGKVAAALLLLRRKASVTLPDAQGRTPLLRLAALGGAGKIAKYAQITQEPPGPVTPAEDPKLQADMARVNEEIQARNTARAKQQKKATQAADAADLAIAQALLAQGADLKAKDAQGNTALLLAEKTGHTILVSLLQASAPTVSPAR